MNESGILVILSGPSGCGKDTVIEELMKNNDRVTVSVSSTTRAKRDNETDGVNYNFVTAEEFRRLIDNGEMLEYAEYNGNLYGTPIGPIKTQLEKGKIVILKIEVKGAGKVTEKLGDDVVSIFLAPPSFEELKRRLILRNTETPEELRGRLNIALSELKCAKDYDYTVINDDLAVAVFDILSIFNAEGKRTKRNLERLSEVCKNAEM